MKKLFLALLFSITLLPLKAQEKTKVLLVGTYHFGGHTSDSEKVTNDSILSRQKELDVVLNKLEQFKPERIYVECPTSSQPYWDRIYKSYRNNKQITLETEIFQIGVKLAARLKLKQGVTCINWVYDDSTYVFNEYIKYRNKVWTYDSIQYARNGIRPKSKYLANSLQEDYDFNDSIYKLKLIDAFRKLNSEKALNRIFYTNVSGMIEKDIYKENIFWSQNAMLRNAHIYQNIIQDILKNHPKRVLVLIGSAHIKPLELYLKAHPIIELVNTEKILN